MTANVAKILRLISGHTWVVHADGVVLLEGWEGCDDAIDDVEIEEGIVVVVNGTDEAMVADVEEVVVVVDKYALFLFVLLSLFLPLLLLLPPPLH